MSDQLREAFGALIQAASDYVRPRRAATARQDLLAAIDSARAALTEQPSECNDNDSPWLVCKPCVATGKCAKAEQPSVRVPLTDFEIAEIFNRWKVTQGASYADLLRAVEKHHGIGVKGEA